MQPVWAGPESNAANGGITFSLLCRFLSCRERFRLLVQEGLRPIDTFNHYLEFGSMWHCCEAALAAATPVSRWEIALADYAHTLCQKYPTQQEQVQHWHDVCKIQFPIYIDYWRKHADTMSRKPLLQEHTFKVPYQLPSRRIVFLRGKFDAVELLGVGKQAGIYLFENKTKGDINEAQLTRQLSSGFDLQTMLYMVALEEVHCSTLNTETPIAGLRYNVIRRPLSGGKGTIVRHKPTKSNPTGESKTAYYKRLSTYISAEPETYFMRWKIEIHPHDIAKFKLECLDPILEQLCDWWEWIHGKKYWIRYEGKVNQVGIHYRYPYGTYNPMLEGGEGDTDDYMRTGSDIGLTRTTNLFPEL